jgi:hypothetical protein
MLALYLWLSTLDSRLLTFGDARMHTVELLNEAVQVARKVGYEVKQDWLGGNGGGHCLVRGRKWILLDLAQTVDEQLDVVTEALRGESGAADAVKSTELAQRLRVCRAA